MAEQGKHLADEFFNFDNESYLERTSRPFYAVIFLLPFIVFYELGTIFINTDILNESQVRVAAFIWLEEFMAYLGFCAKAAWIAPSIIVIIILLSIHIASRKNWYFSIRDTIPMAIECILLAVPLIVLSLFLNSSTGGSEGYVMGMGKIGAFLCAAGTSGSPDLLADIVTGIGAGIYEELVFRLILICVLMIVLHDILRIKHTTSVIIAVIVSAALFSAHHHIAFQNGQISQTAPLDWPIFIFRTIAGVYFAILFAVRGFGITAGTHAFYDILATVINAVFFLR